MHVLFRAAALPCPLSLSAHRGMVPKWALHEIFATLAMLTWRIKVAPIIIELRSVRIDIAASMPSQTRYCLPQFKSLHYSNIMCTYMHVTDVVRTYSFKTSSSCLSIFTMQTFNRSRYHESRIVYQQRTHDITRTHSARPVPLDNILFLISRRTHFGTIPCLICLLLKIIGSNHCYCIPKRMKIASGPAAGSILNVSVSHSYKYILDMYARVNKKRKQPNMYICLYGALTVLFRRNWSPGHSKRLFISVR